MTPAAGIRLLLDQGTPRDAANLLRQSGYDCAHVGEIGMAKAEDREILALASQRNAVAVTLDADFHAILAVSRAALPSVIRIRIQGLDGPALTGLVDRTVKSFSADLQRGCLLTVKAAKTTCHRLPIGGSGTAA